MSTAGAREPRLNDPLRLWPGVALVVSQWLLRFGLPVIAPDAAPISVIGGVVAGVAVVIWWLAFSRARWPERLAAIGLMSLGLVLTPRFLHPSIATGMMGMMFPLYAIPGLCLALVAWAWAAGTSRFGVTRYATLAAAILVACAVWTLVRTDGILGAGAQLAWRWSKTSEEQLLARAVALPPPPPPPAATAMPKPEVMELTAPKAPLVAPVAIAAKAPVATSPEPVSDWPGFRGPSRDGVVRGGLRIKTNWAAAPPVELWRRPVGPAWSSFAVRGGLVYTQEQRGEFEHVTAYQLATGEPVWSHRDATRFWESNAGAGPRGTPALGRRDGRVYALGATGILNALDANTGASLWTRNAAADTGAKLPGWGFSGSPLVIEEAGVVVVAASGNLAAYDLATGDPRWTLKTGGGSYASPHLVSLGGAPQVVLLTSAGVTSVSPSDGKLLWKHDGLSAAFLQPALAPGGDGILFGTSTDFGGGATRRVAVAQKPEGWTVEAQWNSPGLKPYFSDLVIHQGHAFGFDGTILSCIDLRDGSRKWKGGRFGNGQMLLLPGQNLLLVLSEEGELGLVSATPAGFTEVARVPALNGKTWNHPALTGATLLVRNSEEMAAYRLPVEDR